MNGWIGVDLDGTLAEYHGWKGMDHIGKPIPKMVERVKQWISEGKEVRIFTARVATTNEDVGLAAMAIYNWCEEHIGMPLKITCQKDFGMIELWDDRCVQVIPNIGVAIQDTIDIDRLHSLQD